MGSPHRKRSPSELDTIKRVARTCEQWPEVIHAVDGFGHTTFRAGKKPFVIVGSGESGGGSIAIKCDLATQDALVRTGNYSRTPYIGQHGWVSAEFESKLDWREVENLIADAYRNVAPRKAAARKKTASKKKSR